MLKKLKKIFRKKDKNRELDPRIAGILHINKAEKQKEIDSFTGLGVTLNKRKPRLIVSMTSYPERMYDMHFALYSLLKQTLKPDEIILWLAEDEFPHGEKDVPDNVLNLKKHGVTIRFCEDFKSFNKIIHALKEYTDDVIISCDDDVFYEENLLEDLYCAYLRNPDMIHAGRTVVITANCFGNILQYEKWTFIEGLNNHSGLSVFVTGAGGVLYPPNVNKSLANETTLNSRLFMDICPTADDIWMWGMAVLSGIKINAVNNSDHLNYI
ncbi:MAG: hypothetical protein LBS23_00925, partial [Holosporaceae bacterium]|nr:hypothetical protein [Holosporaceae bacterium]